MYNLELIEKIDGAFYSLKDMHHSQDIEDLKAKYLDAKKDFYDDPQEVLKEILGEVEFILNEFWGNVEPLRQESWIGEPNALGGY
tara:strand:+ start:767 stop:1021 length:255 start_codon:yes stop_codon:yes gene_type:complete